VTDVAALPVATVPATTAVASTLPQADHGTSRGAAPVADHSVTVTLAAEPPTVAVRAPRPRRRSVLGRWREPVCLQPAAGTHYRNVDGACVRVRPPPCPHRRARRRCHDGHTH
jgi:hypothetical protein